MSIITEAALSLFSVDRSIESLETEVKETLSALNKNLIHPFDRGSNLADLNRRHEKAVRQLHTLRAIERMSSLG